MTTRLKQAFAEASKLPPTEQNKVADWLLAELESERRWDQLFADPYVVCSLKQVKGSYIQALSETKHKNEHIPKGYNMENLREEALNAISKLPESADIDDIMYRLYIIDKIKKGQAAVQDGKTISVERLKEEIKSW